MQLEINQNGIDNFKQQLGERLLKACEFGAMELQNHTPIDTKRLFTTTRAENLRITDTSISCEIVAGGQRIKGVIKEQGFEKDVDYAIFVENRTGYITQNLSSIGQAIKNNL